MKNVKLSIIFSLITISLIFAFSGGVFAQTSLRNTSEKLTNEDIKTIVESYNFFDMKLNQEGNFQNEFVDNGDGTITDQATGLMWEKEGSSKEMSYRSAKKYVKSLNKKKFAGYDDWRLPTTEELYSLLEPNTQPYIPSVFASKPYLCWSSDDSGLPLQFSAVSKPRKVILDYKEGTVSQAYTGPPSGGASGFQVYSSFVRAVRSLE